MITIYDAIVIGAGPAGAIFAKEIATQAPELSIALINGTSDDRPKVCGGLLAPDAQKILAKLDLTLPRHVLEDPQIFAVDTVDLHSKQIRLYQRHYLNMDRSRFDSFLISLIPENVNIVNGRCTGIEFSDGIYLVTVKIGSEASTFSARSIVGADGAGSIVRRTFFKESVYKYVSIQQWFEGNGGNLPHYSCIFDSKTSDSCSWTIRKGNHYIYGGAFKKEGCREAFDKQKARFEKFFGIELGAPIRTEACLLSSPRRMRDIVLGKKGVYLVGEAAGLISASSFEGISSAMLSGKLLATAYASEKSHKDVIKKYKRDALPLCIKTYSKMQKRRILCSPWLRYIIMKSGIASVKKYSENDKSQHRDIQTS